MTAPSLPILTGIQFAIEDNQMRMWATDRYPIAQQILPWQAVNTDPTGSP